MLDGHVDLRMELDLADAMGSCSTTDAEASVGAPDSGSTTANNRGASSSSFRGSCTGQAAQSSALSLACAPIVVKRQWGGRPALHRRRDGRPGGGRGVRRFGDIGRDCVAADVAADVVSEMMTNIFHKLLGQSAAHAIETHLDADCLSLSLETLAVGDGSRRGTLRISADSGVRKGALIRTSGVPISRSRGIRLARAPCSVASDRQGLSTDATSHGSLSLPHRFSLYGPPRLTLRGPQLHPVAERLLHPVSERLPPYNVNLSCQARIEAVYGQDELPQPGEESTGPTTALPLVSDDEL